MSSHAPSEGTFFVDQQAAPLAPAPTTPPVAPPSPPASEVPPAPPPLATDGAMRDVPLGTLIFRAGLLAEEQLEEALQEGMRTGNRLGEVLSQRGLIRDADLGRLLAGQQGLPYVDIASVPVDPVARQLLPDGIARMQNALAFAFEDGVPVVAVADPTNELVIENVRRALGSEPRLVVAAHGELARKIDEVYSAVAPPAVVPESAASVAVPEPPAAVVEQPVQVEEPALTVAAPAPMPTVVPPAEDRAPEPAQAPVVVAPPTAPAEVPPLHAQAAAEAPLAPEPTTPQPAEPAPEPMPVVPVGAVEPAPAAPAAEPAPASPAAEPAPAAPAAPEPADPGLFVQAAEQALASPVEDAPVAVTPEPAPVEPTAPASEPAVVPTVNAAPEVTPTHFVVLRLTGEDHVEIGGFASQEEAQNFARTVVGRISRAEEQTDWPFFADRFLRPQAIVSVDVVEHQAANWMGSQLRSQWANPSGD